MKLKQNKYNESKIVPLHYNKAHGRMEV